MRRRRLLILFHHASPFKKQSQRSGGLYSIAKANHVHDRERHRLVTNMYPFLFPLFVSFNLSFFTLIRFSQTSTTTYTFTHTHAPIYIYVFHVVVNVATHFYTNTTAPIYALKRSPQKDQLLKGMCACASLYLRVN